MISSYLTYLTVIKTVLAYYFPTYLPIILQSRGDLRHHAHLDKCFGHNCPITEPYLREGHHYPYSKSLLGDLIAELTYMAQKHKYSGGTNPLTTHSDAYPWLNSLVHNVATRPTTETYVRHKNKPTRRKMITNTWPMAPHLHFPISNYATNYVYWNTPSQDVMPKLSTTIDGYKNRTLDRLILGTKLSDKTKSKNITDEEHYRNIYENFLKSLGAFQRKFYEITYTKLASISPPEKQDNGISFAQSGLFIYLFLISIHKEVDPETRWQIEKATNFTASDLDRLRVIQQVMSTLPSSSVNLKFRHVSRLMLTDPSTLSAAYRRKASPALQLDIDELDPSLSVSVLTQFLNKMVEQDSGGSLRNTFEEDELSEGAHGVSLTTMYVRGIWRSAPTLLNGSRPFCDGPYRFTRMIRINDIMGYASLDAWDAEAIEISYATLGLSMLLLVPRNCSLRDLAHHVAQTDLNEITDQMKTKRLAVTLPLYTLRMTLLVPNKLEDMGITGLVRAPDKQHMTLSHFVQRIMFWSEAGRNAFKDDGLEWDERPQSAVMVDRPYIFFLRWQNITLLTGNFVL